MDQTTVETLRPEYLEAVAAARLNLWLIPLLLAAPLLVLMAVLRRWHWAAITGLTLMAAIVTWMSLFGYSETIWKTMEAHAETPAEIKEVTSDTGRALGPFLLGIPFAVFYSALWCGIAFTLRTLIKRFRRSGPVIKPSMPDKPMESNGDSPQV